MKIKNISIVITISFISLCATSCMNSSFTVHSDRVTTDSTMCSVRKIDIREDLFDIYLMPSPSDSLRVAVLCEDISFSGIYTLSKIFSDDALHEIELEEGTLHISNTLLSRRVKKSKGKLSLFLPRDIEHIHIRSRGSDVYADSIRVDTIHIHTKGDVDIIHSSVREPIIRANDVRIIL